MGTVFRSKSSSHTPQKLRQQETALQEFALLPPRLKVILQKTFLSTKWSNHKYALVHYAPDQICPANN